jgi:hypothetical protein
VSLPPEHPAPPSEPVRSLGERLIDEHLFNDVLDFGNGAGGNRAKSLA